MIFLWTPCVKGLKDLLDRKSNSAQKNEEIPNEKRPFLSSQRATNFVSQKMLFDFLTKVSVD